MHSGAFPKASTTWAMPTARPRTFSIAFNHFEGPDTMNTILRELSILRFTLFAKLIAAAQFFMPDGKTVVTISKRRITHT